jgi:hypothetical protein
MSDKDCRAVHSTQRTLYDIDIDAERVERVLTRNDFETLFLKRRDQFTEAGTICPNAVTEYDAWLFLFHNCS